MPGTFPGGLNTIIPLFEASGHLQVSFGRNPNSYPLNQYAVQQVCKLPRGSYLEFNPQDAHRLNPNLKWQYGDPRPSGSTNQQGFTQKNFFCERYTEQTRLDKTAADLADWPLVQNTTERLARQIMLNRTRVCLTAITNTSNYDSSHVFATAGAVTNVTGSLAGGTTADPRIFNCFNEISLVIQASTGVVRAGQISVLMNNATALRLARTREIREYVMQSQFAGGLIDGSKNSLNSQSALPPNLYGFPIVVENSYAALARPESASDVLTNLLGDGVLIFFVKEGDLLKPEMDAGYSSFTQFVHEDMTAQAAPDEWNRLLHFAVTDNFDFKVTAPQTVCIVQNCFA